MDDYMFKSYVADCKVAQEATSYLEIFNYSVCIPTFISYVTCMKRSEADIPNKHQDPALNTVEEHRFRFDELPDEFGNFCHRRGAFAPPKLKPGVHLLSGIRLILQQNAKHPETFTPSYISLSHSNYTLMVRALKLPFRGIESTSVVGPFFWCALDPDVDPSSPESPPPNLQIIFRKSDVRKKGLTRGWELMLSHDFTTGITTGFAKGTPSSDMVTAIRHLKECAAQVLHPFLLPIIILSHDLSAKNDQKQRDAREWLRKLEHAVSMRNEVLEEEAQYIKDNMVDLDQINRDLVECHSQVLWKRPQAYLEIVRVMKEGMGEFWGIAGGMGDGGGGRYREDRGGTGKVHRSMLARLEFYRAKLNGIENYAHTTLERLGIQRAALYNIIAQKESKLSLKMAAEQRRLAHNAKRDSSSMKTLSLLGAIFLPATYLASVFSMTFFDFNDNNHYSRNNGPVSGGTGTGEERDNPVVSPDLWIYFVITVPMTLLIVLIWRIWDKRRDRKYKAEDADIEKGIDSMEQQIMTDMRKRTLSKVRTWDVSKV
ncbi:hypothetical protein QBC41DRAFT_265485 [Cercophora samala]|uniref:Uncharacterized protein n=1 Tax=Cercophora samala TaxID=330535 RepID=A0AA39ZMK9_9PEZI|nr:hypothetical protein QBC41DRAFT_265485 [Cercophora samala]